VRRIAAASHCENPRSSVCPKGTLSRGKGPIRLTDAQLTAVFEAARPLAVRDRDAFLQAVAELLQARPEIGDGDVHRAIVVAQRRHFDPPLSTDEREQPHHRGPISRRAAGVGKLAPELAPDELKWTDFNHDEGGWRLCKTLMKSGVLT
jgi:hypothetical protein